MKPKVLIQNENGTTIILFVGIIVGIIAFSSLITDVGYVMVEKSRLKNTADAAALASVSMMSEDRTMARDSALEYIKRNEDTGITNEILIPDSGYIATVKLKKNVFYFFARLMGYNKTEIEVQSTAKMAPVVAVRRLRPLVIQQQTLRFGQEYTLKEGAGSAQSGNYGAVSLSGTGATRYMDNLKYGNNDIIRIGDYIKTEPGNMSGPTQ
jgi:Flp pilus assembly protein TadG